MIKERMLRLAAQGRRLNREHREALAEGKIVQDLDGRYVTPEVACG